MRSTSTLGAVALSVVTFVACGDSTGTGGSGGSGASGGHGGAPAEGGTASDGGTTSEGGILNQGGFGQGGAGDICGDPNEPNLDYDSPTFLNDASTGITCGGAAVTGSASLLMDTDVDVFKIYTDSQVGCEGGMPTVEVASDAGFFFCIFAQDCDEGPAIHGCPFGSQYGLLPNDGLSGCCSSTAQGNTIVVDQFTPCASFNTALYVRLDQADVIHTCNDYTVSVSM